MVPSTQNWDALARWFQGSDPKQDAMAIAYVQDHIRSWPAQLCRSRPAWMEDALHQRRSPMVSLCKDVTLAGREHRLENMGASALAQVEMPLVGRLDLSGQLLHKEGVEALMAGGWMDRVEALILGSNPIGDQGVSCVAKHGPWPMLRELGLRSTGMSKVGLAQMLDSSLMLHVRSLDLSYNRLGEGFGELFGSRSHKLGRLERLRLERCDVADRVVLTSLMRHVGRLSGLKSLSIASNLIDARGLEEFLGGIGRSDLEELDLRHNEVSPEVIESLNGRNWPALRVLRASWNAQTLARLEYVHRLERLGLQRPDWSEVEVLAGLGQRMLNLGHLEIVGPLDRQVCESIVRMLRRVWVERLEYLSIGGISQAESTNQVIDALCQVKWKGLHTLKLDMNQLEDHHITRLSRCVPLMENLRVLSLKYHECASNGAIEELLGKLSDVEAVYL